MSDLKPGPSWQGEYHGSGYLSANTAGKTGAALALQRASTFGTVATPNGATPAGFGVRPVTIELTQNSINMLDSVTKEQMQQVKFIMVLGVEQIGSKLVYTMRSDDPRLAIKISHVLLIPNGAGELVSALRQRCECKIPPDVCMVTNDTPDVSVKMAYYLGFVKVPKQVGLDVVEVAVKTNSEKRALNEKKRVDRNKPKSSLLMGVSKTDDIGTHVSEYPVAIIMSGRSTRFVDVLTGGTISKFMLKQITFHAPVTDPTEPDVYGMIMHNTRLNQSNCHLFWVNAGEGKTLDTQLTRALRIADSLGKSGQNPEKSVFTALEGYIREQAPNDLYRKQIRRGHLIPDKCLGAGEYGEVYLATQTNVLEPGSTTVTSKQRAVKLLKAGADRSAKEEFTRECQMLIKCEGTGIVRMLGVAVQQAPWLCVLEFLEFGDLRSFLMGAKTKNISLTTAEQVRICSQLASGCSFISKARVVHMDLAARNVLLGQANEVKIADFGMTRLMDEESDKVKLDAPIRCAIKWTAMEAMMENLFSEASDCWSLGIVFWEICTMGAMPYAHVSNMDMLYFLIGGDRVMPPLDCPDDFWAIMCKCWEEAPADRWRFTELSAALIGLVNKYPGEAEPRDLGKYVTASKGEKTELSKEDAKFVYDVPLPTNEGDGYDVPIKNAEGGGGGGAPGEDTYDVPLDGSGPAVPEQAAEDTYDVPLERSGSAVLEQAAEGAYDVPIDGSGPAVPEQAAEDTYDVPLEGSGPAVLEQAVEGAYDVPIDGSGPAVPEQAAEGAYDVQIDGADGADGAGTVRSNTSSLAVGDSAYDVFIEQAATKAGTSPYTAPTSTLHAPLATALPGQVYEPISLSRGQNTDVLYAPPKASISVIKRTEEVEDSHLMSPLEAQMLRALRLIDDDDAREHIINISKLTEAQLSKVVKVDGVPWLATEVGLLKEFPDDKRTPFRKLAKKRGKKLPKTDKKAINGVETYPEPEFQKGKKAQLVRKNVSGGEENVSGDVYDSALRAKKK